MASHLMYHVMHKCNWLVPWQVPCHELYKYNWLINPQFIFPNKQLPWQDWWLAFVPPWKCYAGMQCPVQRGAQKRHISARGTQPTGGPRPQAHSGPSTWNSNNINGKQRLNYFDDWLMSVRTSINFSSWFGYVPDCTHFSLFPKWHSSLHSHSGRPQHPRDGVHWKHWRNQGH